MGAALHYYWRRSPSLGGGKKFVIILGSNVGGGVMDWKGAREWAIERDSLRNKKKYAATWGYDLEIVDMRKRKKYAHEWREGWQKVDYMRATMRKYPDAEWYADFLPPSPSGVPLCQAHIGMLMPCVGSGGSTLLLLSWSLRTRSRSTSSTI